MSVVPAEAGPGAGSSEPQEGVVHALSRERSLARSLPSNCYSLSSSQPVCSPTLRRSSKTASRDSLSSLNLPQQLIPTARLISGGTQDPGDAAIRTQLFEACKRLRGSAENRAVDQVYHGLAESAPLGGMGQVRKTPAPVLSLEAELDAFDVVLVRFASPGEMSLSLDTIDLSAEMTVLLLRQAWRQARQEASATASQSLARAASLCAVVASRSQCRHPLLVHGGLPALVYMLLGRWEGDASPDGARRGGGEPMVPPTSMVVVEAACQVRCRRRRISVPPPRAPAWGSAVARAPPPPFPRARCVTVPPERARSPLPPPPAPDPACTRTRTRNHRRSAS